MKPGSYNSFPFRRYLTCTYTIYLSITVAWTAFRMAARTYHSTNVHLLKLVHDVLPTRHHTARFQLWTSPLCHHCTSNDTLDHLQQSTCNPISSRFAQDTEDALDEYFEKSRTPLKFRETFQYCIRQWITGSPDEITTTSTKWHGSQNLFASQTRIGWRLMTRGFLSADWLSFLQQTLHNDKWRTKHNDIIEFDDTIAHHPERRTKHTDMQPY